MMATNEFTQLSAKLEELKSDVHDLSGDVHELSGRWGMVKWIAGLFAVPIVSGFIAVIGMYYSDQQHQKSIDNNTKAIVQLRTSHHTETKSISTGLATVNATLVNLDERLDRFEVLQSRPR